MRATVLPVAGNGAITRSKLNPDLMLAPGQQRDLNQRQSGFQSGSPLVIELGQFCPRRVFGNDLHLFCRIIFEQVVLQKGFILSEPVVNQGPVGFRDLGILKLLGESRRGLGSLCQYDDTGDLRIEPAYHSQVNVARLAVLFLQVRFGQVDQARLAGQRALTDDFCLFVYNQQMVIFEDDV